MNCGGSFASFAGTAFVPGEAFTFTWQQRSISAAVKNSARGAQKGGSPAADGKAELLTAIDQAGLAVRQPSTLGATR